jgi:hypothetical protein
MSNNHGIKRPASYVPAVQRALLARLSKADLMEVLWDVAMIQSGHADTVAPEEVYDIIVASHAALRYAGWQGSTKLPDYRDSGTDVTPAGRA